MSMLQVVEASVTPLFNAPLLSWTSSTLTMSGDRRLSTKMSASAANFDRRIAGREVLDVERGDGDLLVGRELGHFARDPARDAGQLQTWSSNLKLPKL